MVFAELGEKMTRALRLVLTIPLAIAMAATAADNASATQCLGWNNAESTLSQGQVYENGRFKFQIEEMRGYEPADTFNWQDTSERKRKLYARVRYVKVRSNAERISGEYKWDDHREFSNITGKNTTLCPGVELTMDCDLLDRAQWRCRFTEW